MYNCDFCANKCDRVTTGIVHIIRFTYSTHGQNQVTWSYQETIEHDMS